MRNAWQQKPACLRYILVCIGGKNLSSLFKDEAFMKLLIDKTDSDENFLTDFASGIRCHEHYLFGDPSKFTGLTYLSSDTLECDGVLSNIHSAIHLHLQPLSWSKGTVYVVQGYSVVDILHKYTKEGKGDFLVDKLQHGEYYSHDERVTMIKIWGRYLMKNCAV